MFQIKWARFNKKLIWSSRHFPGNVEIQSQTDGETDVLAAYSGVAIWDTDPVTTKHERLYVTVTTNKDWIPTMGFVIGTLLKRKTKTLLVATNDDDEQKGKLFFYYLPILKEDVSPDLTIFDDEWQPFTNFGNRIVIATLNEDIYSDLIVTAPTSKWLDLPEVGHVHLFINSKSDPFFTSKSTIIRGLPIAHSFFGWNAEQLEDIDGDGVKDFLVAALKVSEDDFRGGVYVFLGGEEKVLRYLTYYEIIQPSEDLPNDPTGFGFFLSQKVGKDREGYYYMIMSRVFSGEVDFYKIIPQRRIKVSVVIDPDQVTVDESKNFVTFDFVSSLFLKTEQIFVVKISFRSIQKPLDATIKLSFKDSSNYHSFSDEYPLETYATKRRITSRGEHKYMVYLQRSYEPLSSEWILQAEITLNEPKTETGTNKLIPVFHEIFYRKISLEKKYRRRECTEGYTVILINKPIWFQNMDKTTIFRFRLSNCKELLTHLIIDAGLSMPCKITISNAEMVPTMNSHPFAFTQIRSTVRAVYNKPTQYESFEFNVEALCQQDLGERSNLGIRLSIKSFFPYNQKRFKFVATAKYAHEFTIETKRLPVITKHICRGFQGEEIIEFNVELLFGGEDYDNELLLSAVLFFHDSVDMKVDSIHIKSNDCGVIPVDDLSQKPANQVTQKFRIQKSENVKKVRLSISFTVLMKYFKDFHTNFKIEPLLGDESPYELKSIVVNEIKYHATFSVKYCKHEWLILIFSALGLCILVTCVCIFIYHKVPSKMIDENRDVTYIVDNTSRCIAY
ncbi:Integrin alpha-4 [Thelohanellus kitauei]|uniref:Integrin alpha-4 n=1 Tax=Thelohanellus kitauei TaxID=669202 RepID=A0A0C2JHQ9_THEKT|nr:Integrin alpha-4 [Thelohanellus kitauei]